MMSILYAWSYHHILLILFGCFVISTATISQISQHCHSVYKWIHGPFVFYKTNKCDSLQEFGNLSIVDSLSMLHESLELNYDEPFTVTFQANHDLPFPMEIRWAQFRGNMKLVRLGENSNSLILHDGESNVQISSVGHLFVVMKPGNLIEYNLVSLDSVHEEYIELIANINQIIGMYIVPSRRQNIYLMHEMTVNIGLDQRAFLNVEELMRMTGAVCRDYQHQETLISDTINNSLIQICIKAMLLSYWEHQRLSQVPVYTWAVPTIPTAIATITATDIDPTTATSTTPPHTTDLSSEYYSSHNSINYTNDSVNDMASTRALWTTKHLSSNLTRRITDWHHTHRGIDFSKVEPPISLVFNQLESPTYYIPLSNELHEALVSEVHSMVADWLGVEREGLVVTGAYSSREYRQGAVVRWHVDPVEIQPITAIVHIDSSSGSGSTSCSAPTNSIRPWLLQVPKSLTQFMSYNISSNATAHMSINTTEHIYDPQLLYNINLQPGEILLLQSSKLPHARLLPLQDEWYTNAFVHFRPKEWMHQDIIHSLLR